MFKVMALIWSCMKINYCLEGRVLLPLLPYKWYQYHGSKWRPGCHMAWEIDLHFNHTTQWSSNSSTIHMSNIWALFFPLSFLAQELYVYDLLVQWCSFFFFGREWSGVRMISKKIVKVTIIHNWIDLIWHFTWMTTCDVEGWHYVQINAFRDKTGYQQGQPTKTGPRGG